MAELVVDHSVLVCVSNKLLKVERGLCLEKILITMFRKEVVRLTKVAKGAFWTRAKEQGIRRVMFLTCRWFCAWCLAFDVDIT